MKWVATFVERSRRRGSCSTISMECGEAVELDAPPMSAAGGGGGEEEQSDGNDSDGSVAEAAAKPRRANKRAVGSSRESSRRRELPRDLSGNPTTASVEPLVGGGGVSSSRRCISPRVASLMAARAAERDRNLATSPRGQVMVSSAGGSSGGGGGAAGAAGGANVKLTIEQQQCGTSTTARPLGGGAATFGGSRGAVRQQYMNETAFSTGAGEPMAGAKLSARTAAPRIIPGAVVAGGATAGTGAVIRRRERAMQQQRTAGGPGAPRSASLIAASQKRGMAVPDPHAAATAAAGSGGPGKWPNPKSRREDTNGSNTAALGLPPGSTATAQFAGSPFRLQTQTHVHRVHNLVAGSRTTGQDLAKRVQSTRAQQAAAVPHGSGEQLASWLGGE